MINVFLQYLKGSILKKVCVAFYSQETISKESKVHKRINEGVKCLTPNIKMTGIQTVFRQCKQRGLHGWSNACINLNFFMLSSPQSSLCTNYLMPASQISSYVQCTCVCVFRYERYMIYVCVNICKQQVYGDNYFKKYNSNAKVVQFQDCLSMSSVPPI